MVRINTGFNSVIYCKLLKCLVFASTKKTLVSTFAKKVFMARMVRELELLTYEVTFLGLFFF